MSTALVSSFYEVDDILYQNRLNSNLSRGPNMYLESRKMASSIQSQPHHNHQHQLSHQQQNQFRNRTGSISSTSSLQSDNSGYSYTSMSMGSPSSSTSSMISSHSQAGSMPPSPVDYRKLDRSVSEPQDKTALALQIAKQEQVNQSKQNQGPGALNVNSSRYKTELCRPFEENGYCKYGDKCQFAHGEEELRTLNRHPKYKTELCRTYHTNGFCPYGPRCHFIHNYDERRLSQQNMQKQHVQAPPSPVANHQHIHQYQSCSANTQMTVQGQQQQIQHLRPKSLNFNLALVKQQATLREDCLGSTADSPPSSVTDSPTMSPTFFSDEVILGGSAFSPVVPAPQSAPPMMNTAFPFQDLPSALQNRAVAAATLMQQQQQQAGLMTPLNVQTDQQVISIAQQLQALTLASQRNNNLNYNDALLRESLELLGNLPAPPASPESISSSSSNVSDSITTSGACGSPLEVSRSLRLPIFSKLSCSDDSD